MQLGHQQCLPDKATPGSLSEGNYSTMHLEEPGEGSSKAPGLEKEVVLEPRSQMTVTSKSGPSASFEDVSLFS